MKVHMRIYKALLKHGHSKFSLEILEYCAFDCIIEREQYYIDLLKPEYNTLQIVGSPLGYKHTEESSPLENLRLLGTGRKHSAEAIAKIKAARLGSIVPEHIRLKISCSKLKANLKHTELAKLKIGAASLARNGAITYVTDMETGKTNEYASQRKAALELNVAPLTLSRYILSQNLYKGRYKIT